ncbi:MAG: DNA repair protein RecN [Bacteroidia bacterium]|nr:DNA repair protein RecN [Bacteroidia bacterium]
MLQHLSIVNYALIDRLEWEPGEGFNVITGETGAGKSILLGALGLLLGNRAEDSRKKCIIEGRFSDTRGRFKGWFRAKDLDHSEVIILRREIGADGRSRAFINDTPVTLQILRELGEELVDIHSQHETLFLRRGEFRMELLDLVAGCTEKTEDYRAQYHQWKANLASLQDREEELARQMREKDFLEFQFKELEEAGLEQLDQRRMEMELKEQEHSEKLREAMNEAEQLLESEQRGLLTTLTRARNLMKSFADKSPRAEELTRRLSSALEELKDIAAELGQGAIAAGTGPEQAVLLRDKLDHLYHLQKKHRVNEVSALLELKQQFSAKLEKTVTEAESLESLRKECAEEEKELRKKSEELHKHRRKSIPALQNEIKMLFGDLALPQAELRVQLSSTPDLTTNGADRADFLFSANPGSDLREIGKVASGGELSRLMLALKSIVARHRTLPTIIFDEIDSGVSGTVAGKVAGILARMGEKMQVIAITHLPQVAGKGTAHFKVFKQNKGAGVQTLLSRLGPEERVREVAGLLSSGKPSENALNTARELLDH